MDLKQFKEQFQAHFPHKRLSMNLLKDYYCDTVRILISLYQI